MVENDKNAAVKIDASFAAVSSRADVKVGVSLRKPAIVFASFE